MRPEVPGSVEAASRWRYQQSASQARRFSRACQERLCARSLMSPPGPVSLRTRGGDPSIPRESRRDGGCCVDATKSKSRCARDLRVEESRFYHGRMLATRVRQKEGTFYFVSYKAPDLLRKIRFISRFHLEGETIPAQPAGDDEVAQFIAAIEQSDKAFQRSLNRRKVRAIVNFFENLGRTVH